VSGVHETSSIQARLRQAASLPDTLAASFDAFETIRLLARDGEDRIPALFAAFMSVADAAVDGREAVTAAPSLPAPDRGGGSGVSVPGPGAAADQVTGALAALSALLRDRLSHAVTLAAAPQDRGACQDAAQAAGRIWQLMAGGDDDARLR
jgi:hypothetical protein